MLKFLLKFSGLLILKAGSELPLVNSEISKGVGGMLG